MPRPRKKLICLEDTPYYHVTSRCVRRAFLCGVDADGKNYEHRRQWIEDRIRLLSSLFTIDIYSYAVMSNHFHIALKICPEQEKAWSNEDVIQRWTSIFKGPLLVQKAKAGAILSQAEQNSVNNYIKIYRERLTSLSWFMKCLNEPLARLSNKEDNCTGHFWESRFKSQALRSEKALLSCMVYIDLNPIRATIANSPEESDHTSIKERIFPRFNLAKVIKEQIEKHTLYDFVLPLKSLAPFKQAGVKNNTNSIDYSFKDYLELVDATGRVIRQDKRGAILDDWPPILKRIKIDQKEWLQNTTQFEQYYYQRFGRKQTLNNSS